MVKMPMCKNKLPNFLRIPADIPDCTGNGIKHLLLRINCINQDQTGPGLQYKRRSYTVCYDQQIIKDLRVYKKRCIRHQFQNVTCIPVIWKIHLHKLLIRRF